MTASGAVRSRTRLTTVLGGCGIILASMLSFTLVLLTYVTIDGPSAPFWLSASLILPEPVVIFAPIILAVAVYILAFGARGEAGLVGDSGTGRTAVVVFASALTLRSLIRLFFIVFPQQLTDRSVDVTSYVQLGLGAVAWAGLVVAVIIVIRRGALNNGLCSGLVIVIVWTGLSAALGAIPITSVLHLAIGARSIGFLLQAVLGVAIALHGQTPALRRRAAIINEHW